MVRLTARDRLLTVSKDLAPSRFTGKKRSIATMASVDVPSFCTAQDTGGM